MMEPRFVGMPGFYQELVVEIEQENAGTVHRSCAEYLCSGVGWGPSERAALEQ